MEPSNPFPLSAYVSPELFCDREDETARLLTSFRSGVNTTLIAQRKIGKTGLIKHAFHRLSKSKKATCLYVDIMHTQNLQDFVNELAKAIIGKLDSKPAWMMKKIMDVLAFFRPMLSYDSLTGEPNVTLMMAHPGDAMLSLENIFNYLKEQSKNQTVIIALDEFQQILEYPEKNVEARLRGFIQFMSNVRFVFSGSHKHMMIKMFMDSSRPFYQSTDWMTLKKITPEAYKPFIKKQFARGKIKITNEEIEYILVWTRTHTYYVQALCNKLFEAGEKQLTRDIIHKSMYQILENNEAIYYSYRNLLTMPQWNLLKALAKEDGVKNILAQSFLQKHELTAASSVKTSLTALIEKEMIAQDDDGSYHVYDVFFSRWLERM